MLELEGSTTCGSAPNCAKRYRAQVLPDGCPRFSHAKDAAFASMRLKPDPGIGLPHWNCVLNCYSDCPGMLIPDEEPLTIALMCLILDFISKKTPAPALFTMIYQRKMVRLLKNVRQLLIQRNVARLTPENQLSKIHFNNGRS